MQPTTVDLDADSRRALEFDQLLEQVARFAATPMGAATVRDLEPSADPERVRDEQAAVEEARSYLAEHGRFVPGGLPDARGASAAIAVAGSTVAPQALRELATVLVAASELRACLIALPPDELPMLRARAEGIPDLRSQAAEVLRAVEPDGRINDDASPELSSIRAARSRVAGRLRARLESILRRHETDGVIQDEFVTQRSGRFVVPVRSDTPHRLRGIVHATSSSGATQFIEPLESVELNNELVQLAEQEQEELQRIVLGWCDGLRRRGGDRDRAIGELARMDGLQARALFAEDCGGTRPRTDPDAALAFRSLRHPLLDSRLRGEGQRCVPLTLRIDPANRVLVLSGPNTGGKTVALKAVGLSVLMSQSGIPVPAEEIELPCFRQVRADIGDHQSIQADLSTYSAHIRAVAGFLSDAARPALFLFDEIGGGTEPTEGAALARAILEALLVPQITTVATTHQGTLKAWAMVTEGVMAAAMEFDSVSLRPTYRILDGAAGVSAGLDIAQRLGLDGAIVARAREHMGTEARQTTQLLDRLRELTRDLEDRRARLGRSEEGLEAERERLARLGERDREQQRREATRALDGVVEQFRRRVRKELDAIRDRRERVRAEQKLGRVEGRLRAERSRLETESGLAAEPTGPTDLRIPDELHEGMTVWVRSLGREGVVRAVLETTVEVLLGRVAFTVDRTDLRVRGAAPPQAPRAPRRRPSAPAGETPSTAYEATSQIKLLGRTVEEAVELLDKYLDSAALEGHAAVRVIHGHGTGRLRQAVREFLKSHVQVRGWRPGRGAEGGDGATVVLLE